MSHAERAHAKLSASGAKRWMTCPPSVRLEQDFEDRSSEAAEEGTAAHELSELYLQRHFEQITKRQFTVRYNKFKKENPWYSESMDEYVKGYVDVVIERANMAFAQSPDAMVLLEERLDFSAWVPDGFGTGDVVIVADGIIEVIDLKYGKGVPVSAEGNPQMRLYALGAINGYGMLYEPGTVNMTIVQPRLDSVSTDTLTAEVLIGWAEIEVRPKAELAAAGEGEFCPTEEACRFCKAKAVCTARADKNLEMVKYDFAKPDTLTHEEIGQVLMEAEELKRWASDVQAYALVQAENHGVRFPGWKLVEGRSNRKYADEEAVEQALLAEGYDPETIYEPHKLLGITKLEKTIGKKSFKELLADLVIKPAGKPTLVHESDKRPELNSVESAIEDFS